MTELQHQILLCSTSSPFFRINDIYLYTHFLNLDTGLMNELVDIREKNSLLLILWSKRNRATAVFLIFPIWHYGNLWKGAGEPFPAVNGWYILPDKADHRWSACIPRQCHSEPDRRLFLLCELDAGLKQLAGDTQSPASLSVMTSFWFLLPGPDLNQRELDTSSHFAENERTLEQRKGILFFLIISPQIICY